MAAVSGRRSERIDTLTRQLESLFTTIEQTRMQGLPMLNGRLHVRAVGFHEWDDKLLGVLITPWFMNLMVVADAPKPLRVGEVKHFVFPSGSYEFVAGYEVPVGWYHSCSLFSPVFEFEDQAAAEATAVAALEALFDEENLDEGSRARAAEIERVWRGEQAPSAEPGESTEVLEETPSKSLTERLEEPVSRRDFLRGGAFTRRARDAEAKRKGEAS